MSADRQHECSLCGLTFVGANCHSICPMSRGCNMVRCPRCGFEFVDESSVVNFFRRLFRGRVAEDTAGGNAPGGTP